MRARTPIGVRRQVRKASLAAATAAFSSWGVANATRASTSWVAGLMTSRHSVVLESTQSPPMSILTVGAGAGERVGETAGIVFIPAGASQPLATPGKRGELLGGSD